MSVSPPLLEATPLRRRLFRQHSAQHRLRGLLAFKTFVMTPNRNDLLFLKELVEAGKAKPVIERRYALNEVGEALKHIGEGRSQGQSVVRISG
jgi:NADPH:quinone reductase-like Zn-dependent oxidoreductase